MSDFDLITMGRSGLDLYAEQVGTPFDEIKSFAAYVGGTPANIAVGSQRLGLRSAILTAVSEDPVGDFILRFLRNEGVETRFIPRKPGTKSGVVLLGIMPPDHFPRVHYRDGCADLHITIDDVLALPITRSRVLVVVGTNLSRSPSRDATLFAAEEARRANAEIFFDLDYRPDLWHDSRAYASSVRAILPLCHTVIGTHEEILAAADGAELVPVDGAQPATAEGAQPATADGVELTPADGAQLATADGAQPATAKGADLAAEDDPEPVATARKLEAAIGTLLALGPEVLIEKRGPEGARIHLHEGEVIDAPGFSVDVQNTLGAGDAFAAGYLYGYLNDWGWYGSARLGNACGALVVTRHACSASCPTLDEVMSFVEEQGGF